MSAHELMLRNISIGYAITICFRIPSAFYRQGLVYLFLNFLDIKHIVYIYNMSIDYQAGMKINHREKSSICYLSA